MSGAYYNEHNPYAAAWLRNLIQAGLIAPGEVDERSIEDVTPSELAGFTQCHFFAGIGGWSYALRRAGWPDDRPIWTGSCPCQPFSAAGKGGGFTDERHLWPAFFHLILERRPDIVMGEQVSSKDGLAWFDLVRSDLEGSNYAIGAQDTCAAGVGAPHIRQRLYWGAVRVADASHVRHERAGQAWGRRVRPSDGGTVSGLVNPSITRPLPGTHRGIHSGQESAWSRNAEPQRPSELGGLADTCGARLEGRDAREMGREREAIERGCGAVGLAITNGRNASAERQQRGGQQRQQPQDGGAGFVGAVRRPGPTNGFWSNPDWLLCRDDKWRPVEPGSFPLVDGLSFRMDSGSPNAGKSRQEILRGIGNAINVEHAAEVIRAFQDVLEAT